MRAARRFTQLGMWILPTLFAGMSVGLAAAVASQALATPQRAQAPPVITSFSPTQGNRGQNVLLVINGNNLRSNPTLEFNPAGGIEVKSVQTINAQLVRAQITIANDAAAGPRQLSLKWGNTTASAPSPFVVVAPSATLMGQPQQPNPSIQSYSPTQGAQGDTVALSITGQNFPAGATMEFTPPTGIQVQSVNVVSATQVQAQVQIDAGAPTGTRRLTLRWGQTVAVAPSLFRIVAAALQPPVIRNFSPTQGTQGHTVSLTINGARFPAAGGAQVEFAPPAGIQVVGVNALSPSQVQAQIQIDAAAPTGARQLSLRWGNVTASAPGVFTVTAKAPAIVPMPDVPTVFSKVEVLQVTPNHVAANSKATVKINGKNFAPGAQVSVSGAGVFVVGTTKFVNSTELEVTLTVLSMATLGARDINVKNPTGAAGVGSKMLSVTKPSGPTAGQPGAPVVGKPVLPKPAKTIKLAHPEDASNPWNFYGDKHGYKFAWKEAPPEKSAYYLISFRQQGTTNVDLKVQVSATYSNSTSRRDFNLYPEWLKPAQVYKLKPGANYEWQVDGFDKNGTWVATSNIWKLTAIVAFTQTLEGANSFQEATVEAIPAPAPGKGTLIYLSFGGAGGAPSGGSGGQPLIPRAGEPVKITVQYGRTWSEVLQKAQLDGSFGQPSLGGGDPPQGKLGKQMNVATSPPIAGAAGGSSFNNQAQAKLPTIPVEIRDPFGISYDGDVCTYWGLLDFGDGSPPEKLGICSGWGGTALTRFRNYTYQKPGDYVVKVYTQGGGFYHLMQAEKISIAPPPCNLSGPLKLAQGQPFQLTSFSGYAPGEEPTIKTYATLIPDPAAELRYTGKGTIEIEWLVDGSLVHVQTVDLTPRCDDQPTSLKMDSDVPHNVVGSHTVSARIAAIAGGDPSTYPKPGAQKYSVPAQGSFQLGEPVMPGQPPKSSGPLSQNPPGQFNVGQVVFSPADLFGPTKISPPIASSTTLKYKVDDAPPPPGVPTEIVIETAQSGTFVIGALSDGTKVVGGKVSGKGLMELFVTDQALTVPVSFAGLDVNYDPNTGQAKVTGGSIAAPLSAATFNVDTFEGDLTQFKVNTTAATLSGKIRMPAASGLNAGGSATTVDFADAEYFLETNSGHLYKEGLVLPASDVFSSGFHAESSAVTLDLSKKKGSAPATLCAGAPAATGNDYLGFVLGSNSKLTMPAAIVGDWVSSNTPVSLDQTAIFAAGVSREVGGLNLNKAAELFAFPANLGSADLKWCGNAFEFGLNAKFQKIPLLAGDLDVNVRIQKDSSFTAKVATSSLGPAKIGPVSLTGKNFSLQLTGGEGVRVQSDLTFGVNLGASSSFSNLKIKQFRIGPKGEISVGGATGDAWQSLDSALNVKFYGFAFNLKEVGAGFGSAGGGSVKLWLGTSGSFSLADIIPVNVGAKADRIRVKLLGNGTSFSFDGIEVDKIGLDFSYAGVKFKGSVGWQGGTGIATLFPQQNSMPVFASGRPLLQLASLRESGPMLSEFTPESAAPPEPAMPAIGGDNEKFYGDLDLSILDLLPGGKAGFLVGNASGKPYFLARLDYKMPPGGIPISPTPLSIQSIGGGIGYRVAWGALNAPTNFANPCDAVGVGGFDAPLESITYDPGRTFTLKAGIGIGTAADNGQLLYLRGVLSLVSSGAISVDSGAWLLAGDRNGPPHACGHIGYYDGTFTGSQGVDLTFHPAVLNILAIKGAGEIQFGKAGWHVYVGKPEAPISASLLGISNVGGANINGYLTIDSSGIGAGAGMNKKVGKEKTGACFQVYGYANADINCTLNLLLNPIHAQASATVKVGGGLGFRIFCVTIGAGGSGTVTITADLPPPEICGKVKACGEVCFIACKSGCAKFGVCVP